MNCPLYAGCSLSDGPEDLIRLARVEDLAQITCSLCDSSSLCYGRER